MRLGRSLFPIAASLLAAGSSRAGGLAGESSPFLRALDATPVAWRTWSEATLSEAQRGDRALFLLLGPTRRADCDAPEAGLFTRRELFDALERSYLAVAVDRHERPELFDLYATALALLEPEAEPEGRALWVAATPEGWPFAGGVVRGDRAFVLGLGPHLDELARRYFQERAATRARAGAMAASLRQAQASLPATGPLDRTVVARALKGLRDAAGPGGSLQSPPPGALRLLLAEAGGGDADARRLLAGTLDALAREPAAECRLDTRQLAERLRVFVGGYALTGDPGWRAAAESLAGRLLARLDAQGTLRAGADDERVFARDNGLAIGALALSGSRLQRPADLAAARAAAEATLQRLAQAQAARGSALLDDYACLAEGLLELHEASGEARWRDEAARLAETALVRFSDPAGGFFETEAEPAELPARPRGAYDGALPAGSAVMAGVLLRLAPATGQARYAELARSTVLAFLGDLQHAPRGMETLAAVAGDVLGRAPASPGSPAPPAFRAQDAHGALQASLSFSAPSVRAGGSFAASLELEIATGWSLNAHRPASRDLYGLSLSLASEGLEPGTVLYPPATNVPRRFSREPVLGHTGRATVKLPLRVPAATPAGELRVRLRLGFQACTERDCQPPDSLVLEAPVQVLGR